MSGQEILIAVGIVAVLLVALYAVAKGRGFKFIAQRAKTKLGLDISGRQEVSPKPSGESSGSGSIKDVSVLDKGKVEGRSSVNIHIGHNIEKEKD